MPWKNYKPFRHDDGFPQGVLVLIEEKQFFRHQDSSSIAAKLQNETGVSLITVAFVPPRFLTKTSSGKFNRSRCVEDYNLFLSARGVDCSTANPLDELQTTFAHVEWNEPVGKILDSLSLTVLSLILVEADIPLDLTKNLDDYFDLLKEPDAEISVTTTEDKLPNFHIVSIADKQISSRITAADLHTLGQRLGARVTLEHICLPPSGFLLSVLVFHDYFQPRVDGPDYEAINSAMKILRSASLILADDMASFAIGRRQILPVLAHNLERDPNADLNMVRWQRYTKHHDQLPITMVSGSVLSPDQHAKAHVHLSEYLKTPIFRISVLSVFADETEAWELQCHDWPGGVSEAGAAFKGAMLVDEIGNWIEGKNISLSPSDAGQKLPIQMVELAHFCSFLTNVEVLEKTIAHYDSFCIVGQPASIAALPRMIEAKGKSWVRAPSFAPEVLDAVKESFDAILICGAQGPYKTTKPTFSIMPSNQNSKHVVNVSDANIIALGNSFLSTNELMGSVWFGEQDAQLQTEEDSKKSNDAFAALHRGVCIAAITHKKHLLSQAERNGDKGEIRAAREALMASKDFDLYCPNFEKDHVSAMPIEKKQLSYIAGVSLPRSGHHLLERCLRQYFESRFTYCEFYSPGDECCHTFPCQNTDRISFSKNHDNTQDLPQLKDQQYLIQYREFLPAALSNFELYVLNGSPDTVESLKFFLSAQFGLWQNFVKKWVDSPFAKSQIIVEYSKFMDSPVDMLAKVISKFDPENEVDLERVKKIVTNIQGHEVKNKEVVVTESQGVKSMRKIEDHRFYNEQLFETVKKLKLSRDVVFKVAQLENIPLGDESSILMLQTEASESAVAVALRGMTAN